jgi:hypothetical membrane protein
MSHVPQKRKRPPSVSFLSGIFVVVCYLTCTIIAWSRFPPPYSPLTNWLSDLGNPEANPSGAGFYNVGLAFTAGGVLFFFWGLTRFRLAENRGQTVMMALTVGFGSLGAFAMLMTTLYPINHAAAHSFWSMVNRIGTGTGFAFSIAAFRYHAWYPRWLLFFGAFVAIVNLCASIFLNEVHIAEWPVIALWLSYILLLGFATRRLGLPARFLWSK